MDYTSHMEFREDRLLALIAESNISQAQLAREIGVSAGMISNYIAGDKNPGYEALGKMADVFKVSTDYLFGRTDDPHGKAPLEEYDYGPIALLPVYEEAAAGKPCFVDERPVDRLPVSAARVQHDLANYILVRVCGDSMILSGIIPGGLVLVHRQSTLENGQTGIIRIKDDGVTIKRFQHLDDGRVMLIPHHPTMREIVYREDDIQICGRVVQSITDIE